MQKLSVLGVELFCTAIPDGIALRRPNPEFDAMMESAAECRRRFPNALKALKDE